MNADLEKSRKRLEQTEFLTSIIKSYLITDMVTVYLRIEDPCCDRFVFSAVIPLENKQNVVNHHEWDLHMEFSLPEAQYFCKNDEIIYSRFGNDDGYEPLVVYRCFHEMREPYIELTEEFRLFHNLYYDVVKNLYLKFDDAGNCDIVAIISTDRVQIRAKELRQFLAVKNMFLSIQFDCREYSEFPLEKLGLTEDIESDYDDPNTIYSLRYGGHLSGNTESFSIVMGKYFILPLPKSKSGVYGTNSDAEQNHCDFIIDCTEEGTPIRYTGNPKALADDFGKNPDAPKFLTPVHFSRDVLDKYYNHPSKYTVEHGILRCGSLWSLVFDNDCDDKVAVWLGDLGRSLPFQEQLHWQSHNILPAGEKISNNYFKTQLMAEPVKSSNPVFIFLSSYSKLREESITELGWPIILPLKSSDNHYLQTMRIPASNEQKEFDELVLALTKILIDSLNEKELKKCLPFDNNGSAGGSINTLEAVFTGKEVECEEHINFLRELQGLRSACSAHRKGTTYERIAKKLKITARDNQTVFKELLERANVFIDFLIKNVSSLKNKRS